MSYKTILVHVDGSKRAAERVKVAARIALAENAHLIGIAITGVSKFIYQSGLIGEAYVDVAPYQEILQQRAQNALAEFEQAVAGTGLTSFEKRIVDDEAAAGTSVQARCGDLVVIGQIDPNDPSPTVLSDFPEQVVLHAGKPVLIVPYAEQFDAIGKNVLISWNGSVAASRALSSAIPLLRRAETVQVVIFNPENESDIDAEQSGSDLVHHLARHGIETQLQLQTTTLDLGNALLSLAADVNCDLLVMGGYGHSRFREILLGGVTRTVLESMTVPVLMSH